MDFDVIIVGGGVIGLSIARELHRRGTQKIVVIDAGDCGGEASWAAGGMLGPQAESDEFGPFFELCQRSRDLFPDFAGQLLEETGVDIELDRTGTLYLAFSDEELEALRDRLDGQMAVGLAVSLLDADRIRKIEPALSAEVLGGLFFARDWQVDNRKLCLALRRYCKLNQITLLENTVVNDVVISDGKASGVRYGSNFISAHEVVVSAGAWSSEITVSDQPAPVNVEPIRGQMITFRASRPPIRHVIHSTGGYIIPRRDGRVLAGSTTEKRGFERQTTDAAAAALFSMAVKIAPPLADLEIEDRWCGFRPRAADGLPILGRTEGVDGLFVATAHYRNGILLAPLTAQVTATKITGGDVDIDLSHYAVDRFNPLAGGVSI